MKHYITLIGLIFFLQSDSIEPVSGQAQICTWKAIISSSDIRTQGRLETKTLVSLQADVSNDGTCVWRKSEVYMKVKLLSVPRDVNKSTAEGIFNTSQKFYLNNDYVTKGGTGRFIVKFDAVQVGGLYSLELTIMNKEGKEVSNSHLMRLSYTD